MTWDPVGLAKDILAMSNVRDGGTILIGVEDGTFARVGVTAEMKATYNIDEMRDQISPYADPSVSFGVTFPRDRGGLEYVAIEVRPFREIPTICARDGSGLQKGSIYYRSESRRPQSARVSNSPDMRDIVDCDREARSTATAVGFHVGVRYRTATRRRTRWPLMRAGLLEEIQSKSYWRVNFRPTAALDAPLSLPRCNEVVDRAKVSLRGWDYPHMSSRRDDETGHGPADQYYEHWIAWWAHHEFWRMYRSSQFLHYRGLKEDWEDWASEQPARRPPQGGISVLGVIWHWTEVFEFLFRLHENELYRDGARVDLSLENTAGRQLWINEWNRMPFSYERRTDAPRIVHSFDLSPDDLGRKDHSFYLADLRDFFEHFDWTPSDDILRSDQRRLLTRSF